MTAPGGTQQRPSRVPLSEGYLVVDPRKCAGCTACMLACSLVHEGTIDPSLSRIQVVQTPFAPFPRDISVAVCRQCANPVCFKACPTGALRSDSEHGHVRVIDEPLCNGCRLCLDACPYQPSRIIWDPARKLALKCDLCAGARYSLEEGGSGGRQACIEVCPMRALALTRQVPNQRGDDGYIVNLRNEHWAWLGYPNE